MNPKQQIAASAAVSELITLAGSQELLAEKIGVWQTAVSKWKTGHTRMAPQHAKKAEQLFGINKARLRPDLWG